MKAGDLIGAALALIIFGGFLGIIAVYVPQPVLVLVFVLGLVMAAFDFAREIIAKR